MCNGPETRSPTASAQIGRLTGDRRQWFAGIAGQARKRVEQPARVRMPRSSEEGIHAGSFDDPPRIHDLHAIAGTSHHAQIMRDQHQRQAFAALQSGQQFQDLRLNRHVQRRGRLVGDQ